MRKSPTLHAHAVQGTRCSNYGQSLYLQPNFVYATEQRRLWRVCAFAQARQSHRFSTLRLIPKYFISSHICITSHM